MTVNYSKSVPVTRKNTNKSTSAFKYARDCHTLNMFLKGDMTAQVDEVFTSRGHKTMPSEAETSKQTSQTPNHYEISSAKLLVQNLRLEVNELKKSQEDSTNMLNKTISSLERKNKSLIDKLEKIEHEFNAKVTQYDAKLKWILSSLKDLEQFNVHEMNTKMNNLETSNKRLVSAINKMRTSPKSPTALDSENSAYPQTHSVKTTVPTTNVQTSSHIWRPAPFNDLTSDTTSSTTSRSVPMCSNPNISNKTNIQTNVPQNHSSNNSLEHNYHAEPIYTYSGQVNPEIYQQRSLVGTLPPQNSKTKEHLIHKDTCSSMGQSFIPKAAENLTAGTYVSMNPYCQHKKTSINSGVGGAPSGSEIGPTTAINNTVGPLNDMMNQSSTAVNPNASFQPYMPYTGRPPNQNFNHTINLGAQQQSLTISAPTMQPVQPPAVGMQNNFSHSEATEINRRAHNSEHYEDSSQDIQENSCPSDKTDKTNKITDRSQNTEDVFIGVRRRRRYQKYFLSNIDESSTRKGIFAHFQQNGVRMHELNLFRGRNSKLCPSGS